MRGAKTGMQDAAVKEVAEEKTVTVGKLQLPEKHFMSGLISIWRPENGPSILLWAQLLSIKNEYS